MCSYKGSCAEVSVPVLDAGYAPFSPPLARRREWATVCHPVIAPRKRGKTTRLHLTSPRPNKFDHGSAGEPALIICKRIERPYGTTRTILSVFVASPSDVDEERNRLEEVIRELNTTWARDLGIRLELVRWETHAYPSFGEDPQSVINEQIPNDYDLFIGLMWYRFGTQTGRAGSGTIEEFQRAKKRFDRDSYSLQLMIYFKDAPAPVPPSRLDHSQLAKVSEFRSSLGDKGGLYWSFVSVDDFEKLVRLHLSRHVQSWRSKHFSPRQSAVTDEQEQKEGMLRIQK